MKAKDTVIKNVDHYLVMADRKLRETSGKPLEYNAEEFVTFSRDILNDLLEAQAERTEAMLKDEWEKQKKEWRIK